MRRALRLAAVRAFLLIQLALDEKNISLEDLSLLKTKHGIQIRLFAQRIHPDLPSMTYRCEVPVFAESLVYFLDLLLRFHHDVQLLVICRKCDDQLPSP